MVDISGTHYEEVKLRKFNTDRTYEGKGGVEGKSITYLMSLCKMDGTNGREIKIPYNYKGQEIVERYDHQNPEGR